MCCILIFSLSLSKFSMWSHLFECLHSGSFLPSLHPSKWINILFGNIIQLYWICSVHRKPMSWVETSQIHAARVREISLSSHLSRTVMGDTGNEQRNWANRTILLCKYIFFRFLLRWIKASEWHRSAYMQSQVSRDDHFHVWFIQHLINCVWSIFEWFHF